MRSEVDLAAVPVAMREVAAAEILPRFRSLAADEIQEKSPGDLVTAADQLAEVALTERLRALLDVPVVGEEAVAADPSVLAQVVESPLVWVVDPVDGTANFVDGSEDFGVMVALVEDQHPVAAWILHPTTDVLFHAVRGGGAWRDDERIVTPDPPAELDGLTLVMKPTFLPTEHRAALMQRAHATAGAVLPGRSCAAVEYPDVIEGVTGGLVYWRTFPWDHAPGTLLALEAGCVAVRPDGGSYQAGDTDGGLLIAHVDIAERLRLAVLA